MEEVRPQRWNSYQEQQPVWGNCFFLKLYSLVCVLPFTCSVDCVFVADFWFFSRSAFFDLLLPFFLPFGAAATFFLFFWCRLLLLPAATDVCWCLCLSVCGCGCVFDCCCLMLLQIKHDATVAVAAACCLLLNKLLDFFLAFWVPLCVLLLL